MKYREIWESLKERYGEREAKAIARYLLDVGFGINTADIYCGAVERLKGDEERRLEEMTERLANGEPVQYVTGVADFCGRQFEVNSNVLIPRPETEELCRWIIEDENKSKDIEDENRGKDSEDEKEEKGGKDILDIGTGSGCIAITLALEIKNGRVAAWDISDAALCVARKNSMKLNASVNNYCNIDILCALCDFARWDVIVSNPPYICNKERAAMESNVKDYEPESALFVPDDDPLLFYRAIALYAKTALRKEGKLYFEINPLYAKDIENMLAENGFTDIEIRNDQFGKQRMTKATIL